MPYRAAARLDATAAAPAPQGPSSAEV